VAVVVVVAAKSSVVATTDSLLVLDFLQLEMDSVDVVQTDCEQLRVEKLQNLIHCELKKRVSEEIAQWPNSKKIICIF
jgi:hypothetical protein